MIIDIYMLMTKKGRLKMNKKIITILSLTASVLMLCSCSSQKAQEGFTLVSDKSCDFTFEVPSDWNISYTDSMLAANHPQDNASVCAYAFDTETDIGADDYWDTYRENYGKTLGELEVKNSEESTLDGVIARKVYYTTTIGERTFDCIVVICSRYGSIYTLNFTTVPESIEDHLEDFENIISSYKFD